MSIQQSGLVSPPFNQKHQIIGEMQPQEPLKSHPFPSQAMVSNTWNTWALKVSAERTPVIVLWDYKCMLSHFSRVWLWDPTDCSPPGSSSMGFSRQEYWSRLPCSPPGNLPDLGIEPGLPYCRWILYHPGSTGITRAPLLSVASSVQGESAFLKNTKQLSAICKVICKRFVWNAWFTMLSKHQPSTYKFTQLPSSSRKPTFHLS